MNRSSFGETTAGWIVNASWAWPASFWRSWIWQTWWLAGTSFSPPLPWWIPRWRRWSATRRSSLWRAPWGRAVNAHKTYNSTRFIFLWKGSHSPPILRALVVHDCCTGTLWNVLEFLQNKRPFCNIPELRKCSFSASETKNADKTSGLYLAFNTLACMRKRPRFRTNVCAVITLDAATDRMKRMGSCNMTYNRKKNVSVIKVRVCIHFLV